MAAPEMVRWCGSRGACDLDKDTGTVVTYHDSTMALPGCLVPKGAKAYYEMEIVQTGKTIIAGWATLNLERSGHESFTMVGQRFGSWGVDGIGQAAHHDGKEGEYEAKWKDGDVIGLAVDLESSSIHVSVNGSFDDPNGLLFSSLYGSDDGIFAAASFCDGSKSVFNFGDRAFKFAPPDASFKPVATFAGNDWESAWQDYNTKKTFGLVAVENPGRQLEGGKTGGVVRRWIGDPNSVMLDLETRVVTPFQFATVANPDCMIPLGAKGYYEIEILQCVDFGVAGFATVALERSNIEAHYSLGDVPGSWGVNGDGSDEEYGSHWDSGDVIGLAVDLDNTAKSTSFASMHVSVNGSWEAPHGLVCAEMFGVDVGVFPAVSLCPGSKCVFNFGEKPFKFAPPDESYKAVTEFAGTEWEKIGQAMVDKLDAGIDVVEDVARQGDGAVVHRWIGSAGSCSLDLNTKVVTTFELATVAVPGCSVPLGAKGYYEIEVLHDKGIVFAGWATMALEKRGEAEEGDEDMFVGVARGSWSVNGAMDPDKRGEGEVGAYDVHWKKRDVVGLAVDLQAKTIQVSLNGSFDAPNGQVFSNLAGVEGGVFPACSLFPGFLCAFNFGEKPFKFDPPDDSFAAVVSFKDAVREQEATDADRVRQRTEKPRRLSTEY